MPVGEAVEWGDDHPFVGVMLMISMIVFFDSS